MAEGRRAEGIFEFGGIPGRGYQFLASVRAVPDETPSAAPAVNAAPAVDALSGDRASIAVLPFTSLSSDPRST